MNHFWDVSLSNIVTWALIVIGYISAQYVQTKLLAQRMDEFSKWVEKHTRESDTRDEMLVDLKISTEKLTVIASAAERRLEKLEDR